MRRKVTLIDLYPGIFDYSKEAKEMGKHPVKDNKGHDIYYGDWVEIISVPNCAYAACKDILGRKYQVLDEDGELILKNEKYKEKYMTSIAEQWYLGKRCLVLC